jgi:hypothetical protein
MNLTIAPARLTVMTGRTFSVNLLVNNVVDLQKVELTILYDPTTIDYDSALEGVLLKSDGAQTHFTHQKVSDGVASIQIERVGAAAGVSRGGALAAIRFRSLAAGQADIAFGAAVAQTAAGEPIAVNMTEAEITVAN